MRGGLWANPGEVPPTDLLPLQSLKAPAKPCMRVDDFQAHFVLFYACKQQGCVLMSRIWSGITEQQTDERQENWPAKTRRFWGLPAVGCCHGHWLCIAWPRYDKGSEADPDHQHTLDEECIFCLSPFCLLLQQHHHVLNRSKIHLFPFPFESLLEFQCHTKKNPGDLLFKAVSKWLL